jgi:hypothetical protein
MIAMYDGLTLTSLAGCVSELGGASCARIHDKVYGLMGNIDRGETVSKCWEISIDVDYNEPVLALFCCVLATTSSPIDLNRTRRIFNHLELHRNVDAYSLTTERSSQLPRELANLDFDIIYRYAGTICESKTCNVLPGGI